MNIVNPYILTPPVDTSLKMEFTTTVANTTVYLPIRSSDTSGKLVFDDGTSDVIGNPDQATHTFTNAGTYVIKYYGAATSIAWGSASTAQKQFLTKILDWGITGATLAKFEYCSSLLSVAANLENTTTNLSKCFSNSTGNPDVSLLDTSNVTNMRDIFYNNQTITSIDVSNWDVSNVTNFQYMFRNCYELTTLDVSSWDLKTTGSVTLRGIFFSCRKLATIDVSDWNTSAVNTMRSVFRDCYLATPDTSKWDTSNVNNMQYMFYNARVANPGVAYSVGTANGGGNAWDVSNVTKMDFLFNNAYLADPDVSNWDTGSVTIFRDMFFAARAANPDVSGWDTSSGTNLRYLFNGAILANPDVSLWNFGAATNYENFLNNSNLSTTNYDGFLNRLNAQRITYSLTGRAIGDIDTTYTTSVSGAARTALLANSWTFTDDGGV